MIKDTPVIDESVGQNELAEKRKLIKTGARTLVMQALNLNGYWVPKSPVERMHTLGLLLRYGLVHYSTQKRILMNVEELADRWIDAIVKMCLSHDKAEYDAADAQADKLLTPILAAPIKQVREFYNRLEEKLRTNPQVPFLVHMAFTAWGEAFVKNAPDEGVKKLKRKLANDIAELAEDAIADQIPNAVARALMWRDEETLKQVKEGLESGAKPKLVGRQSCLFLEVKPRGKKEKVSVMV